VCWQRSELVWFNEYNSVAVTSLQWQLCAGCLALPDLARWLHQQLVLCRHHCTLWRGVTHK